MSDGALWPPSAFVAGYLGKDADANLLAVADRVPLLCLNWACIYLVGLIILKTRGVSGWSYGSEPFICASRVMGFFHSIVVVVLGLQAIFDDLDDWQLYKHDFLKPLGAAHWNLWSYTLSYFLVDSVHFICFEVTDMLMMAHHVISVSYLLSVGVHNFGAGSLVFSIVFAEMSNPFQSSFFIVGQRRNTHQLLVKFKNKLPQTAGQVDAQSIADARVTPAPKKGSKPTNEKLFVVNHEPWKQEKMRVLSPMFTFVFIFIRVVFFPSISVTCILQYMGVMVPPGRTEPVPMSQVSRWGYATMILFMQLGSFVWAYDLYRGYKRFLVRDAVYRAALDRAKKA